MREEVTRLASDCSALLCKRGEELKAKPSDESISTSAGQFQLHSSIFQNQNSKLLWNGRFWFQTMEGILDPDSVEEMKKMEHFRIFFDQARIRESLLKNTACSLLDTDYSVLIQVRKGKFGGKRLSVSLKKSFR